MNNEAVAAAVARFEERSKQRDDAEAAQLQLSPQLEARRRQHNIPIEAFQQEALFDRILIWQLDKFGETYGQGPIVKHVNVKEHQKEETPRGIIVSAGLHAFDVLWGHGIEVGHYVNFVHLAPFRLYLDDHYEKELVVLRDGDLIASEDVRELIRSGVYRVEMHEVDDRGHKQKRHVLFDTRTNSIRVPWAPAIDNQL